MRIAGVESTDLFVGTAQRPLQVVRVTVVNDGPDSASDTPTFVHVQGPGVRNQSPFRITGMSQGEQETFEVPVEFSAPYQPGSTRRVTVTVETSSGHSQTEADITAAEPGWTMWMVSHFHYDPVWWNTQGQFTEAKLSLPDENGNLPDVRSAFDLVGAHLDKARKDSDYKFVLAEIDYLKPYFDAYPQDRSELRRLMAEGRVEIVGGNYNEPSTTLICAESMIRNAVAGIGFQRDVFGGDPKTSWMVDVFGHDPGYPGLMAAAGLTSSAWARGPFHQWGPRGVDGGGVRRMQFKTEFEWISPDGGSLLTHYMAHHYGAGWRLNSLPDLQAAEREAYEQFSALAQVAATRNVMLPVGVDHVIPARWVTDVHRSWNSRYVWPRFTTAVPSEFFAAVRAEAGLPDRATAWITPQSRDMNPVYTGKDVSYIDGKQGQRAIETAVLEAERLATLAWLAGAPYPHEALDKAWRLLAYGAHHDGITGVESDQVYLDLLAGWREAWDLGSSARRDAVRVLAGRDQGTVSVCNGLARPRSGVARITLEVPDDGTRTRWLELRDDTGKQLRSVAEGIRRRPDGSLAGVTLTFLARDVPALGYRAYQLHPAEPIPQTASGWQDVTAAQGTTIENDAYLVTADPARGGTVTVLDKRTGASVLAGPGNELVLQDEYAQHPKHDEGPWHLSPKGPGQGSASGAALVRAERCAIGSRLVASYALGALGVTQEIVLFQDADRVEFRTHVDGFDGHDQLLRVRFPAYVPGGLPVYQTATAVIGRSFGVVDVDSADHPWTRDCAAQQWFGLSSVARVRTSGPGGLTEAIGIAEIVCPDDPGGLRGEVRDLVAALAAAGVTATCSDADGPRYGAIDADSNLPDVRIAVGGPEANGFTAEVLSGAGPGYAKELGARLGASSGGGMARVWVPAGRGREDAFGPDPDLRGANDLPVLIVAGRGPGELSAAVTALAGDLADALIDGGDQVEDDDGAEASGTAVSAPTRELADRSVAILNRGTPGCVITPDGTLHMSLMRSCSAWPSGIWIDGDRRTAPDGSSFAWQHWSHTFEYALVSGAGDWRAAGFAASAEDYNHDLIAVASGPQPAAGTSLLTAGTSLLTVEPATVTLSALKPRGNPLASGRNPDAPDAAEVAVAIRLRETSGRATTARVRLAGVVSGVAEAFVTDLLEESDGVALPVGDPRDGSINVDMPAFGTVTLVARTSPRAPAGGGAVPPAEPVEPIYARYWLHGKGPAPAGNVPVAAHFSPTRVALAGPGDTGTLTLTVGCGAEPATGTVELVTPAELTVSTGQDLRYDLAPGDYAAWELAVAAGPGTGAGRYFVAARIRDGLGHLLEDTAMVAVGERRWPDPALPPEEALEVMQADYGAAAAEAEVAMLTPEVSVAPGGRGEIVVNITSRLASELRGEAQLISPFGTWDTLGPRTQGFSVQPQATTAVRFGVRLPSTALPGATWWALVKVMYYGRVRYTPAIPVFVRAE